MISGFVFNQDVVIHTLLLVVAVICAFVVALTAQQPSSYLHHQGAST